jgi:hypothetical protein
MQNENLSKGAQPMTVVVEDVVDLLKKGYTRFKKEDLGYGSIEEHYGLKEGDVRRMFTDNRLKGLKTSVPTFKLYSREELTSVNNTEAPSHPPTQEIAPTDESIFN